MTKLRATELNKKNKADLEKQLHQLKTELSELRVAKVTGAGGTKLGKIRVLRKSIARVMTVMHTKQKDSLRQFYSHKNLKPKGIRTKTTRAMRRALTDSQKNKKSVRTIRLERAWPERIYALKQ